MSTVAGDAGEQRLISISTDAVKRTCHHNIRVDGIVEGTPPDAFDHPLR